jgi:1-acyl-sn-glycerol-3-phosphate acyltransferase
MQYTIFTTPVVNTLLRALSVAVLRLTGWTVAGSLPPDQPRCVLIGAPHTSNWDLPYTLMVAFVLRLNLRWMGKAQLFRAPFGPLMRWLGGIPVDRSQANQLVAASARFLRDARGALQLVVPPEGTRGGATRWRTGFYYIALGAGVPIVMAYMDYPRKLSGLGPVFQPTGDVDADMAWIRAYYAQYTGKHRRPADGA